MKGLILPIMSVFAVLPVQAQLRVPEQHIQQVVEPANVVMDRGSKLEIFPTQRAVPQSASFRRAASYVLTTAAADAPIGPRYLGVVFNYAMQQQGYISGEIAFKMKTAQAATAFDAALYPGLRKITSSWVYVVNARTPAEFLTLLKRLQSRSDLAWVEPMVTYGSAAPDNAVR
jgi:hypothetical protein